MKGKKSLARILRELLKRSGVSARCGKAKRSCDAEAYLKDTSSGEISVLTPPKRADTPLQPTARAEYGLSFWCRLCVGLGLLFVLSTTIDLEKTRALFSAVRWPYVVIAGLILASLRVVMSMRWQCVLASEGIDVPLWELVRITFMSLFIAQFLPGVVGPDMVRGYALVRRRGKASQITSTVIVDRVIGVYAMFSLGLIGAMIGQVTGRLPDLVLPLIGAHVLMLIGWVVSCMSIQRIQKIKLDCENKFHRLVSKIIRLLVSITDVARLRRVFPKIFTLSMLVQLLRCVMFLSLYRAFRGEVSIIDCLTFIPMMYVLILLPISVGGLGVREGVLIFFFSMVGVPAELSISVGLLSHMLQLIVGLPGLIPFVFDRRKGLKTET